MKNKLVDLNSYLFEQLERLTDDETLKKNFDKEIERSKALTNISKEVIKNAKLLLDARKYMDKADDLTELPLLLQQEKEADSK